MVWFLALAVLVLITLRLMPARRPDPHHQFAFDLIAWLRWTLQSH